MPSSLTVGVSQWGFGRHSGFFVIESLFQRSSPKKGHFINWIIEGWDQTAPWGWSERRAPRSPRARSKRRRQRSRCIVRSPKPPPSFFGFALERTVPEPPAHVVHWSSWVRVTLALTTSSGEAERGFLSLYVCSECGETLLRVSLRGI